MFIYPSPINRKIKSVKTDLLLNINDTHIVLCASILQWFDVKNIVQIVCPDYLLRLCGILCSVLHRSKSALTYMPSFLCELLVIKFLSQFKFQIIFLLSIVFMYFRLSIMSQKQKDHSVASFQED